MDSQCSLYGTILDAEMCIESPVRLYVNLIMHSLIYCLQPGAKHSPRLYISYIIPVLVIYLFILKSLMFAKCLEDDKCWVKCYEPKAERQEVLLKVCICWALAQVTGILLNCPIVWISDVSISLIIKYQITFPCFLILWCWEPKPF